MIDEIVEDLLRHADRLRVDADLTTHPLERADLLERAREFEQMASAADDRRGWRPRPDWPAPEDGTIFSVFSQADEGESYSETGAAGDPILVAA